MGKICRRRRRKREKRDKEEAPFFSSPAFSPVLRPLIRRRPPGKTERDAKEAPRPPTDRPPTRSSLLPLFFLESQSSQNETSCKRTRNARSKWPPGCSVAIRFFCVVSFQSDQIVKIYFNLATLISDWLKKKKKEKARARAASLCDRRPKRDPTRKTPQRAGK